MSFIRPDLAAAFARWREPIAAACLAAFGVWVATRGGWLLFGAGVATWALAGGWALIAIRRVRFLPRADAPGVVELDEGQIGYFGPTFGGFVALSDLSEIRVTVFHGTRSWRLRTADGQVLTIPVGAAGAERLFDAFAALPGIDMGALAEALAGRSESRTVWRRGPVAASAPRTVAHQEHHEKS